MRSQILLVPVVVLLLAADDAPKDAKQLQGSWEVVSFEVGGKKVPAEEIKTTKVVFKDDTMTLHDSKREEKGTVKLDPSKKPEAMDFAAAGKEETALFIYELDGDKLKLCWRKPGGERPAEFTAKDTDGLMVLQRAK